MSPSESFIDLPRNLRITRDFPKSVEKLTMQEQAQVAEALGQYSRDPSSPGLNLERLNGKAAHQRLWSIRATQDLRVILTRDGEASTLIHAGRHDEAYRRAQRVDVQPFDLLDDDEDSEPVEPDSAPLPTPTVNRHDASPEFEQAEQGEAQPAGTTLFSFLWRWSSADLIEAAVGYGLTINGQQAHRLCKTAEDDFDDLLLDDWPGDHLAPARSDLLDMAVELSEVWPEEWRARKLSEEERAAAHKYARDITEQGATSGLSILLTLEEIRDLAAAPIEDWMIFLHPNQQEVVERQFNGPARVRGSAGTGKTVVALHKAVWLANNLPDSGLFDGEPKPVLFTTYIKSLTPVFESLYERLPHSQPRAVEFRNIDSIAYELCSDSGHLLKIDDARGHSLFKEAHKAVIRRGTPLHRLELTENYLKDEITHVIKGRSILSLHDYLELPRVGRRVALQEPARKQMWELNKHWSALLSEEGLELFQDRVLHARDYARTLEHPRYRSIIVDEAQDLTQTGIELLTALVAERVSAFDDAVSTLQLRANSILIVGDRVQKVLPGGFTLPAAGIDIRGRSVVLSHNYRNSPRIFETATATALDVVIDGLSEELEDNDTESSQTRTVLPEYAGSLGSRGKNEQSQLDEELQQARLVGVPPQLIIAPNSRAECEFLSSEICDLSADQNLSTGDFGVFTATVQDISTIIERLRSDGLSAMDVKNYRGKQTDEVKVGTFDRAKGLEFKVVFLMGVSNGAWPFTQKNLRGEERDEAEALALRKLFVAMTRARDSLYVLCSQNPHPHIQKHREKFEMRRLAQG